MQGEDEQQSYRYPFMDVKPGVPLKQKCRTYLIQT